MVRRTGKLSARKVATVGPGKFGDGGGLWLCMKNNGGKSWVFRYMLRGRAREMGLGSLSTISLSESSDDLKKALSAFNDAWEDYREKLLAAYWVQAHEKGGTIRRIIGASLYSRIAKDRVEALLPFYEY